MSKTDKYITYGTAWRRADTADYCAHVADIVRKHPSGYIQKHHLLLPQGIGNAIGEVIQRKHAGKYVSKGTVAEY